MSNRPSAAQRPRPTKPPAPDPTAPYDANALLAEIRSDVRTFRLGDPPQEFAVPSPTAWPDAVLEHANNGDVVAAGRAMLGDAEYDRFVAVGGNAIFLQFLVEKLHGVPLGESPASSSS